MTIIIQDWLQDIEDVDPSSLEIEGNWEQIYRWLAAPDPSSNYYGALNKRQRATGDWFIQGCHFDRWCREPDSFIWLYGAPRCGKTLLASTIIEHCLQQWQNHNGRAVLYFYFDFVETEKRKHEGMIRSLITQLTFQTSSDDYYSGALLAMFEACRNGQYEPTRRSLLVVLRELINRFTDVYIVLDALDECVDRDGLLEDLKDIIGWNTGKLHLLVTSRMEDDDVQTELRRLSGAVSVVKFNDEHRVKEDLGFHNPEPGRSSHQLVQWQTAIRVRDDGFAVKIDAARVSQWVLFQLDLLKKCMGGAEIRKVFGAILATLEEKYATILSSIPEWYKLKTLRILQWLVHARRPLRLVEIADAIAYSRLVGGRLSALRSLLRMLPNMVAIKVVTNDTGRTEEYVQLAHFSVQEYLVSDRIRGGPAAYYSIEEESANAIIAETCLAFLLQFNETHSLTHYIHEALPLSAYAAKYWTSHALKAGSHSDGLNLLTMELFSKKPYAYINFIQILYSRTPWTLHFSGGKKPVPSPLYYACLSGLTAAVSQLLESGVDINRREGAQGSALHVACARGNVDIITLLLDKGAVTDEKNTKGETPAALAGKYGHEGAVEILRKRELSNKYDSNETRWVTGSGSAECGEELWAALMDGDDEE